MSGSTFDLFIQRVFDATGIRSQNELASVLGVNRSAITQARKKNSVPDKWVLKLFRKYGLNPDWIESGLGASFTNAAKDCHDDFIFVPKVKARLCAGGGSFEVGAGIEGYYSFQYQWLKRKGASSRMVMMDITGNSMEPEMKDGDTVLIDQDQKDILAGAIYAVGVDDTIMIKRLEKRPHKLVLLSDNVDYSPIYLDIKEIDSIRIIGKVLWICREVT
ncbi:MAG: S24 family peptidase [Desulfobacterales bacterium]|nr:S24 family peptidase [Desulfobacterales bacterium]MDD4072812.1 S24 family peptidase [Desulfobacterales bacterium]MDD4391710.1 S24 family peptidase [Desulfobacterales bacterium]